MTARCNLLQILQFIVMCIFHTIILIIVTYQVNLVIIQINLVIIQINQVNIPIDLVIIEINLVLSCGHRSEINIFSLTSFKSTRKKVTSLTHYSNSRSWINAYNIISNYHNYLTIFTCCMIQKTESSGFYFVIFLNPKSQKTLFNKKMVEKCNLSYFAPKVKSTFEIV